jgi:hypothetical protein
VILNNESLKSMNVLIIGKKKSNMMRLRCQKVEDHAPLMDILYY